MAIFNLIFLLYYNICTSGKIIYFLNLIRSRQTYYKISNLQIDIFRFSLCNLDRKRWKGKVQVVITVNGTNESENGSGILLSEKFQTVNKMLCYHMTSIRHHRCLCATQYNYNKSLHTGIITFYLFIRQ